MNELIFLQTNISIDRKDSSITIHGKTENNPIICKVINYKPYFYIKTKIPINQIQRILLKVGTTNINNDHDSINNIDNRMTVNNDHDSMNYDINLSKEIKINIYGYNKEEEFIKIECKNIRIFNNVRNYIESFKSSDIKLFESNINFILKFMVDLNITGMQYLKIKNFNYFDVEEFLNEYDGVDNGCINKEYKKCINDNQNDYLNDNCINNNLIKIQVDAKNIEPLEIEGEFSKILKMKILSFDIETINQKNTFPNPKKDPIIQIGNTISYGSKKKQIIFSYKKCSPISGILVFNFENEIEMLKEWKDFVLKEDPDILLGYNIKDFDLPYIFERAKNIKNFNLSRTNEEMIKSSASHNKQVGIFGQNNIIIDGRLIFDMLQIIRRDYKLHSYSLNSVSVHFLNEQKEDLPYYFISDLWNEGPESRVRIATYCLKDTLLPLILFEKLKILINYTEISRVTGIPIEYQMTRGSSVKVFSLILRKAHELGCIIPTIHSKGTDESYEGAFVMDPVKGFYNTPIAVLDFASLYPSIIIAYNLCYTTVLNREQINEIMHKSKYEELKKNKELEKKKESERNEGLEKNEELEEDYYNNKESEENHNELMNDLHDLKNIYISPTNNYFVKPKIRKGILPLILETLITERRKVKKKMINLNEEEYNILNGRQYALKIAANSLYGFTGSSISPLPYLDIPQSVTSIGRELISETKRIIESQEIMDDALTEDNKMNKEDNKMNKEDNKMNKEDNKMNKDDNKMNKDDNRMNKEDNKMNKEDNKMNKDDNKMNKDDNRMLNPIKDRKRKIKVLYGDTDSVMINFDEPDIFKVFKLAKEFAKKVSDHFFDPLSLEFEKVYYPFLLMNKKRYAGLIYTSPEKIGKIDTKGIETVRRDNCGLVRNVIEKCLKKILIEKDVDGAKKYVKNIIKDLYLDKIDLNQLVITKALTKQSEDYNSKQAHVFLADKMAKRKDQSISTGERIAYVIIKGDKKSKIYEKSEDPLYAIENNIPIDIDYYIEHQLSKPLFRLFDPIMDNVSELFIGEHTRKIIKTEVKGPMGTFLKKNIICLKCKNPGKILCKNCIKSFPKIFLEILNQLENRKLIFSKCWTECQRCQQSVHKEVACVNRDCPINYMRIKTRMDVLNLENKMELLKKLEW